jgi:hypothetical protein
VQCEPGSYRAGWVPFGQGSSCSSCGVGVFAAATDRVLQYDLVTGVPEQFAVTTTSDDCCEYTGLSVGRPDTISIVFSCTYCKQRMQLQLQQSRAEGMYYSSLVSCRMPRLGGNTPATSVGGIWFVTRRD